MQIEPHRLKHDGPPQEASYELNLEILSEHSSLTTRKHVESAEESCLHVEQDPESDHKEWRYTRSDQDYVLLHSRRSPEREAKRQIDQWTQQVDPPWDGTIIALGFAGMYHLAELTDRLQKGAWFIVIEPDPALFKTALHHCDLRKLLKLDCRLLFIVGNTPDEVSATLKMVFREIPSMELRSFLHPASHRGNEAAYEELKAIATSEARIEGMNRGTRALFSDEWVQNCLVNYPILLKHPGIDAVENIFKGRPAIVVGAGPSLNATLPEIYKVRDQYLIVAVGQAYRSLLANDITPDIVVAVDSDPKTWRQYENLPKNDAWLFGGDNLYHPIIQAFGDRVIGFSNALLEVRKWLNEFNAISGRLQVGGTVAISAIDTAAALGCDPIIMTGIDLAFLDDGTTHANKTQWEGQRQAVNSLVAVPGNRRENVLTSKQFAVYIDIMNTYLTDDNRTKGKTFYNATNGGAKLACTQLLDPSDLENLTSAEPFDFKSAIQRAHDNGKIPTPAEVEIHYDKTINQLEELQDLAKRAIKLCERLKKPYLPSSISELLLEELGDCDKEIKQRELAINLANCAILGACMHIISERSEDNGEIGSSLQLYRQLSGAADWLIGLMHHSLKNYQKDITHGNEINHAKTGE